ncbi:MFS general substrate transporter [Gymnopus androsaceus JB14]|uniref:MFS general substrate transporter n=1 Tax=Gymnopus androsaceus JB14 TaxID=1447944 RepID=A0A6A4I1C7_9AGAR|nr:MFS general substrate transporter [Gymnopus androsaceus JB14]
MASISPRASLWLDPGNRTHRMSVQDEFDDEFNDSEDQDAEIFLLNDGDERTRLDRTIDRIGMGTYQWTLLSLCGFGWMADNMWIQAVAIILPRVQQHYTVPDNYIGAVSSSMFAGMMIGALGWGTCSDLMGRSMAFNATLFFTSIFGLLASFANSFSTLCLLLFLLGSAVGGSMPTDGTLLLEHMPNGKKYLVTALSVFFSFGAVLSAVVALLVTPRILCDVETQNRGWKYLLISLGLITLTMFLARMVFFRLHESPRFLVHAGRHQEALESLQMISKFNGSNLSLALEDVDDQRPQTVSSPRRVSRDDIQNQDRDEDSTPFLQRKSSTEIEVAENINIGSPPEIESRDSETIFDAGVTHYSSTGESSTPLGAHVFATPTTEFNLPASLMQESSRIPDSNLVGPSATAGQPSHISVDVVDPIPQRRPRLQSRRQSQRLSRRASSMYEKKVCSMLPHWLRRPLWGWWDRVMMALAPEWLRTTVLVWAAWWGMSLAYTMFNVFLPKLLESSSRSSSGSPIIPKTLEDSLWDVVIFTMGGCPGAIHITHAVSSRKRSSGAYMVESSLGRRWSLAGSTFITALFCVGFIMADSTWAVRASTVGISLSATAMWAVLYGWTPEIFGTEIRGTACGIASAMSRIGGMIAPVLGGVFLMIDRTVPVYTSVGVFCFAGICVLLLKEDAGDGGRKGGLGVVVH